MVNIKQQIILVNINNNINNINIYIKNIMNN